MTLQDVDKNVQSWKFSFVSGARVFRSAVSQENRYRLRSDVRAGSDRHTGARASVNTRRARVVIFRVDLSGRESCARSGPRTGEEWSSVILSHEATWPL